MISVQHNGCYTSYPIHQFLHPQQLIRCASIKDTKWVKQLLLAFTAGQVHGPSTLKTLFSSDSGRSKPPSKTSGTIVAIKIQISIHQKKALSELCRTITIGRCELRWCESYSRFWFTISKNEKLQVYTIFRKEQLCVGRLYIYSTSHSWERAVFKK